MTKYFKDCGQSCKQADWSEIGQEEAPAYLSTAIEVAGSGLSDQYLCTGPSNAGVWGEVEEKEGGHCQIPVVTEDGSSAE